MAKLRFLGPETHYVAPLERLVEPDEVVDVPDHLMKRPEYAERVVDGKKVREQIGWLGLEWPDELWTVVAEPKTPKATSKDEE